ncbi:MAG: CIA30 family protein [Nitrosospira sp.]|nr:CIA30 family protein [Nitrosospira sp.]
MIDSIEHSFKLMPGDCLDKLTREIMVRELFCFESASSVENWTAIDDAVMGGVSHSHFRYNISGYSVFEGFVSLEQNGGFASIRSCSLDLTSPRAVSCVIEVYGDGKRYKLNLVTDNSFDGVKYQSAFDAPKNQWTLIKIPLSLFRPNFRGRLVSGSPPLDPTHLRQIGLMIADRQAGPFRLAIRYIKMI